MNSTKDVLKILPSLFEEFIDITNLKFYTIKLSSGKFLAFAYNEDEIVKSILNANLTLDKIDKVYFSQIELKHKLEDENQTCARVDGVCLGLLDEKIIQVPSCLSATTANTIDINSIALSKNYFYINTNTKYIDNTNANKLSIIFILFTLLLLIKIFINNQIINEYNDKVVSLKKESNLPSSMIQTRSIVKAYKKTYKLQKNIRDTFAYIFNAKKSIGAIVESVEFKNNVYKCKFKNATISKIKKYITNKYKINKIRKDGNIIVLEFRI
jgi:hypothetical protein